jgi:hypothetical protein
MTKFVLRYVYDPQARRWLHLSPAPERYAYDLFEGAVWRHLTAEEVNHWTKAVETPQGLAWFAEAVAMNLHNECLVQWSLRNAAARRMYAADVGPHSDIPPAVMHLTCEAVHTAARLEVRRRHLRLWPDVRAWGADANWKGRLWEIGGRSWQGYNDLRWAILAEYEAGGHHAHA